MRSIVKTLFALTFVFACGVALHAQTINYDESKVPSYVLPDPLITESGKMVRNIRQWEKKRRPELLKLFEREMFGKMPGKPADLHFEILNEDKSAFGGLATRKEVKVSFDAVGSS